jgi:hypothetical protein
LWDLFALLGLANHGIFAGLGGGGVAQPSRGLSTTRHPITHGLTTREVEQSFELKRFDGFWPPLGGTLYAGAAGDEGRRSRGLPGVPPLEIRKVRQETA